MSECNVKSGHEGLPGDRCRYCGREIPCALDGQIKLMQVVYSNEGGENLDLFVYAHDAAEATTLWADYYDLRFRPAPDRVLAFHNIVPTGVEPRVIAWGEIEVLT